MFIIYSVLPLALAIVFSAHRNSKSAELPNFAFMPRLGIKTIVMLLTKFSKLASRHMRFLHAAAFAFALSSAAPAVSAVAVSTGAMWHTALEDSLRCTPEDSARAVSLLQLTAQQNCRTTAQAALFAAMAMRGMPYAAGILECPDGTERLTINMRATDCITLVETATALAITARQGMLTLPRLATNIQALRYRDGMRDGYASRLHYFSQWAQQGCQRGIMEDAGAEGKWPFTGRQRLDLHFLSRNASSPSAAPALRGDTAEISSVAHYERELSGTVVNYIPKNLLAQSQHSLKAIHDGDILALVTTKKGLDVSHVGMALWKGGRLYLLNASSLQHKVVVGPQTLYNYMAKRKSLLGVRVIRLK